MAKGIKFKRKELNQPDQFISTTDVFLAYCSKHKTGLTSFILVVLLVVFSGFWVKHNQNITNLKMEAIYFQMEQIKTENKSNPKVKLEKIENLLIKFDEGPQKQRATMILADQYYDTQSYDRAIALYLNILANILLGQKINFQLLLFLLVLLLRPHQHLNQTFLFLLIVLN